MRLRVLRQDIVNSSIADRLTEPSGDRRLMHFERFTSLWHLCQTDSRIQKLRLPISAFGSNLFLVLEALLEDDLSSSLAHTPALRSHVRSWVLETMHAQQFHTYESRDCDYFSLPVSLLLSLPSLPLCLPLSVFLSISLAVSLSLSVSLCVSLSSHAHVSSQAY